ncbi:MAG: AAA family ATPase [Armatimonadetes bacterium]|nr:AAA family ATPase [Armatimonadota bacterium]MDW8120878.1 AAA domain-containing protein [Armatimonadota bacterium]
MGLSVQTVPFPIASSPPVIANISGFWIVNEPVYDRNLTKELEALSSSRPDNTALGWLLQPTPQAKVPLASILRALANPIQPTLSQASALAHCFHQPLTLITGPPGTGKTRLIIGLIIEHLMEGRSVLLASRINRAVDAAVELADRLVGPGLLLRTGNQSARTQLLDVLKDLRERQTWSDSGQLLSTLPPRISLVDC